MRYLKQSTSVDVPIGPFVDSTDGVTAETALTITQPDIRLKKNASAWAQKNAAQTLSHEENGFYEVTLDATDTNTLGLLRLAVFETGAAPVWEDFMVMPANVWDSLFGADLLQVDTREVTGTAQTARDLGAQLDATVSSRLATAGYTAPPSAASIRAEIDTNSTKLDVATSTRLATAGYTAPPSAAANADAVWDEDATAHQTQGTFGQAIGDPALSGVSLRFLIGTPAIDLATDIASFSSAVPDAVLAEEIEAGITMLEAMRGIAALLLGKVSGAGTGTEVFRSADDTLNRVTVTVDANGNRTAVTLNL